MSADFYFTVNGAELRDHTGAHKEPTQYPYLVLAFCELKVYSNVDLAPWRHVPNIHYGTQSFIVGVPTGALRDFWSATAERIEYFLRNGHRFYVDQRQLIFFELPMTRAKLDSEINALKLELSSLPQR